MQMEMKKIARKNVTTFEICSRYTYTKVWLMFTTFALVSAFSFIDDDANCQKIDWQLTCDRWQLNTQYNWQLRFVSYIACAVGTIHGKISNATV